MKTIFWIRISMMLAVGFIAVVFSMMPEGSVKWDQVLADFAPSIVAFGALIACAVIGVCILLKRARSNVDDEISEMYNQYEQRNVNAPVASSTVGAAATSPVSQTGGFGKRG